MESSFERPVLIQEYIAAIPTVIVPIFHTYLSEVPNERIVINQSYNANDPLIIPENTAKKNTLSVEKFMDLVVERWEAELAYEKKLIFLKDKIIDLFNNTLLGQNDFSPEFCNFIYDQEDQIIDKILNLTKIDQKKLAGEFCMGLMNGFHNDIKKDIHKIAKYILFQNFLTPYPDGLYEFIFDCFSGIQEKQNTNHIAEKTNTIKTYIKEKLETVVLKTSDYDISTELLQNLMNNNKIISLIIDLNENTADLILMLEKYEKKYIESIELTAHARNYCKYFFEFMCQSLEIVYAKTAVFNSIFDRVSKSLNKLSIGADDLEDDSMPIFCAYLVNIKALFVLNLDFSSDLCFITDKGLKVLFDSILEMSTLTEFCLNASNPSHSISDFGIEHVAQTIGSLKLLKKIFINVKRRKYSHY